MDELWKKAFHKSLIKAFHVYISHNAIAGVPLGQYVNPKYILPSRMVFTNKGAKELINALLKARWAFDGHRDPEAGQHQTAAPTVSLVGHNLLIFLAAQHRWTIVYEDVSAAFLQGQELPPEREIYVKVPHQYPQEVLIELHEMLGPGSRKDIVKLTEGGFGLPESPRLWYLEYRQTLCDLGGRELKLAPGFSCFYNDAGQLHGITFGMSCTRGSPFATRGLVLMVGQSSVEDMNDKILSPRRLSFPWRSTAALFVWSKSARLMTWNAS